MLAIWRPALENNRTVAASLPWLHGQAVVLHSDQPLLQQTEIENGLLALMQDKQHQWDPYGASPNSFLDCYHAVQRLATAKRQTASAYLKQLVGIGVLEEKSYGREKLYMNTRLLQELNQ